MNFAIPGSIFFGAKPLVESVVERHRNAQVDVVMLGDHFVFKGGVECWVARQGRSHRLEQ